MDEIVQDIVKRFKTTNPFEIAKQLNIHIRYSNLGNSTRGFYYRKLRRRFIVIHEELDDQWKRFVCAHELAHDRLHPGISRFFIDDQSFFNAGKFERQANLFAVKLLTYEAHPTPGETKQQLLQRCSIPAELHKYM